MIDDNVFEWSVALIVLNEDSLYYGGYFKAKMTFPRNYPHSPPGTSPLH
jgi:ubiquitin-conjugating enzyme E2 R